MLNDILKKTISEEQELLEEIKEEDPAQVEEDSQASPQPPKAADTREMDDLIQQLKREREKTRILSDQVSDKNEEIAILMSQKEAVEEERDELQT